MTRVRRNPDSPDSVRTRLAAIATERRADFQAVLTEFVTERFLYRLGASAHASRFVLKGATLLALWQLNRRRATWDIDLHAPGRASVREIVVAIREILGTRRPTRSDSTKPRSRPTRSEHAMPTGA
jgi:predicted nucleotidyltransferase component of viral defense system